MHGPLMDSAWTWPVSSRCLTLQNQRQGHLPLLCPQKRCWKKELANGGRTARGQLYGRWWRHSGGGHSTLNQNTPSRAQPYPSRKGEIETGWVIRHSRCTAHLYHSRTSVQARGRTVRCQQLVWMEPGGNKCYKLHGGLDSFFAFFFHPMMYFIHADMKACLFTEGEGYHKRMGTGQLPTKMDDAQDPPFPHPTHIALRISHHPVVKPQSTMVEANNIVQIV